MIDLARVARAVGASVDILRIGCEAAQDSFADDIRELFSLARRTSVRSTASRTIIRAITGTDYPVERDFAFTLAPQARAFPRLRQELPTIGVVTASISTGDLEMLTAMIRAQTRNRRNRPVRFLHIPHSRSYFNYKNNDCVTGEILWSMAHMHHADHLDAFRPVPFDPDPLSVLRTYRRLDGVISSRYHGLVFGRLAEIPTLAMGGGLIKLRSFIDDNQSDLLRVSWRMADLPADAESFVELVLAHRDATAQPADA